MRPATESNIFRKSRFCSCFWVAQRFSAAITGLFSMPALQFAEKLGFVSGHRFSDAASRVPSIAPLGAEVSIWTFSAASPTAPPWANKNTGLSVCARTRFWPNRWDRIALILAPEGRLTIARRFSAGKSEREDSSPGGTTESSRTHFSP